MWYSNAPGPWAGVQAWYLGYALTTSESHRGQLFSLNCLNETKVHILQLFALNYEIFHVYMQWQTESWISFLPPQQTPNPFPLAYSLTLPHAAPKRGPTISARVVCIYLVSLAEKSRSEHQAFLSFRLPPVRSLGELHALLGGPGLHTTPVPTISLSAQTRSHTRTHAHANYPAPLINGRAGECARPAPC